MLAVQDAQVCDMESVPGQRGDYSGPIFAGMCAAM